MSRHHPQIRRRLLTAAITVVATLGLAGAASAAAPIRVATIYSAAPITLPGPNGTLTGFEPELVRAAAKAAGVRVRFVRYRVFDDMLTAVINGDVDMAASTLTITPTRQRVMQFGAPNVSTNQAIGARKDSPIASRADLNGLRVGTVEGTTGELTVRRTKGAKVRLYASTKQMIAAAQSGEIDAFVSDLSTVSWGTRQTTDLHVAAEIDLGQVGAWAYPLTDAGNATRATMARGLRSIQADGTHAAILERWGLMAP